jgi:hypothetical protein
MDFRLTMIDTNIWGGFRATSLSFHDIGDIQRVLFNEISLRHSRGFEELWVSDSPRENLSAARRHAKFGWMTKPE